MPAPGAAAPAPSETSIDSLLEVPIEMPTLVEMLCRPRYVDLDPAHRWLRETLRTQAAALADPAEGATPSTRAC